MNIDMDYLKIFFDEMPVSVFLFISYLEKSFDNPWSDFQKLYKSHMRYEMEASIIYCVENDISVDVLIGIVEEIKDYCVENELYEMANNYFFLEKEMIKFELSL